MGELICTGCLEFVSSLELNGKETPCCGQSVVDIRFVDAGLGNYEAVMASSDREHQEVLDFISKYPSDSKKRRKGYLKPNNTWPGRLTPDTKSYKKLKKGQPPQQKKPDKLDITIDSRETYADDDQWVVKVSGTINGTVTGKDREEARKRARAWIRSKNHSITRATLITEEPGITTILFEE